MMVSTEDMNYLAQQSSDRISMILAGMTSLMNDTDQKVEVMESQTWFQRMVKTITGKNKLAKEEIQQNHDKLNAYMSQAMAELYNRDCINQEIMMSLGTQINELYADHLQLKEMLGAFVTKLNEKIESIDNFHMLNTEIEQGVYSGYESIVAICLVMSQMDKRVLEDNRKLDILKRSMQNQGILEQSDMMLTDFLLSIINMPDDKVGLIYMELGSIPENFVAKLVLDTIESYHFLPDMAKKMKNKNSVVESIITGNQLDDGIALNIADVYNDFMESKCNISYNVVQIENRNRIYPNESNAKKNSNCDFSQAYVELTVSYDDSNYEKCEMEFNKLQRYTQEEDAEAQYYLGKCYIDDGTDTYWSKYVGRNIKIGYEYIEKSAKQGDVSARITIAEYYAKQGDKERAIDILNEVIFDEEDDYTYPKMVLAKVICDGDLKGFIELSDQYLDNLLEDEEEIKVLDLIEKSAEAGDAEALYYMGIVYLSGNYEDVGYNEDITKARKYLLESAAAYNDDALMDCGDLYYYGFDGFEQDYSKAYEMYNSSIRARAYYMQGVMCWLGRGVEENDFEAVWNFELAAEKGYVEANIYLAEAYYKDMGIAFMEEDERMQKAEDCLDKIIYECDDEELVSQARAWRENWFGY